MIRSERRSLPRRLWNTAGVPLLSCLLTFLLFMLMNQFYGIFPCGTKSIVWCDMEQQAVPLLLQFRELLRSGESVFFSPLDAGGMHFYSVFCFFLSNPFSLLILITDIPADQLVTLIVFLKLSLAAGTASFWFRSRIRECPAETAVLLGIMYGCSGYGLFYYQNLMWLDVMVLLPLLMFSMRRMLKRASPLPFLLTLTAIMITCFYISFMVIIFVVLYMAVSVRTTIPASQRGKVALRFLLSGMLAGGIASVVWLPCLIQILQSARGISIAENLMQTSLFHHLNDKVALLGCTCIIFSAAILLWQKDSPRISSRKRDRIIFLLLTAAVFLDPVNTMWHNGSYQAFPLRWGMIPLLLLLTLAGKQFSAQYDAGSAAVFPKKKAVIILCGTFTAVVLCELFLHHTQREHLYSYSQTLWISNENLFRILIPICLLTAAYMFIIIFRQNGILSARICNGFLAALFLCEFTVQYDCYIGYNARDDALFTQTVQAADAVHPDDPTARFRLTKKYAHANMLGALGCPTLAHYTSLTRKDFLHGIKRFGYSSYWMEITSTGGTVLSDAFWNVQYLLGIPADFPSWTVPCQKDSVLTAAHSTMILPAAHYTDLTPEQIAELPDGSRIGVQKALAEQLSGSRDIFTEYEPALLNNVTLTQNSSGETVCTLNDPEKYGEIRYSLPVSDKQAVYFDLYSQTGTELDNERNGAVTVLCGGQTIEKDYPQNNRNGFLFLGEPEQTYYEVCIVVRKNFTCESFGVFGIAEDALSEALRQTNGTELHYQKGVYSADFDIDHAQTMVLAAAYDEGFSAEINGKPADVFRVNDCQLAVRLPDGSGTVTLRYHTPGMLPAAVICGITAAAAVLLYLLRRKIPPRICNIASGIAVILLQAGTAVILLTVYLIPIGISIYGMLAAI